MSSAHKRRRRLRRKRSSFTKAIVSATAEEVGKRERVENELNIWKNTLDDKVRVRVEQELGRKEAEESRRVQDLRATVRTLLSEMHHQASELEHTKEQLEEAQDRLLVSSQIQDKLEMLQQQAESLKSQVLSANARADRYRQETHNAALRARQRMSSMQANIALLTAELAAARRRAARDSSGFAGIFGSKQDLMRLIRLCHPDKHGDSLESTEITQILNACRDKLD